MNNLTCGCKITCPLLSVAASAIIGIVAAFLQISGMITVTPAFLWVTLGVALVYLAVLTVTAGLHGRGDCQSCVCGAVNTLLAGILGAALFSVILLAVGITATSVISAILVGTLIFFLGLILTGNSCFIRCLLNCER